MTWYQKAMKDVAGCEKPRGAAKQVSIRGFPNGVTHPAVRYISVPSGTENNNDFLSSGERTGNSLNRMSAKAVCRCSCEVAGNIRLCCTDRGKSYKSLS